MCLCESVCTKACVCVAEAGSSRMWVIRGSSMTHPLEKRAASKQPLHPPQHHGKLTANLSSTTYSRVCIFHQRALIMLLLLLPRNLVSPHAEDNTRSGWNYFSAETFRLLFRGQYAIELLHCLNITSHYARNNIQKV